MLKATLDSLDGVDAAHHAFYVEKEGKFQLQVEGLEDTGALKRAKDHEKSARKSAETKNGELQSQIDALTKKIGDGDDDKSRKKGDVEALEKSWQSKYDKREGELNGQLDGLKGTMNTLLVDNVASTMAAEIAIEGASSVVLPHIQKRLAVEERDGKMVTVVMDKDGKSSASTLTELKEEFKNDTAFASIILGSKGSGGGAGGSGGGGGAPGKKIDLSKASPKEMVAYLKSKKS